VANVLRGVGARLERLPAEILTESAAAAVTVARGYGGRVAGEQLTAIVIGRRSAPGAATVVVAATPARQWAWLEDGIERHAVKPKRARAMAGDLRHPIGETVIHPGVPGTDAWTRATDELADETDRIAGRASETI
jgi:hypothetical protein